MWKKRKIGVVGLVIIVLTLVYFGTAIAAPEAQSEGEPLIVAIKSIPPFVIIEDERITGFSIDLWEEIAQQMKMPFEYVVVDTVEDQLQMVTDGEADLAIAAITINSEREEMMLLHSQASEPTFKRHKGSKLVCIILFPIAEVSGYLLGIFIYG